MKWQGKERDGEETVHGSEQTGDGVGTRGEESGSDDGALSAEYNVRHENHYS